MQIHTYQAVLQQRLLALDISQFCLASPSPSIYDLSEPWGCQTRLLFDIHSIFGNPLLKFLATPLPCYV